jgi:two-component system OmpR family sensor kinase
MTYMCIDHHVHDWGKTRRVLARLIGSDAPKRKHGLSRESLEWLGAGSLAAAVLALELALVSTPGPAALATALLWASLPLQAVAWVHQRRRVNDAEDLSSFGDLTELSSRAHAAEEALRKDQELLHELRATVVGISMTHQLLEGSGSDIQDATRQRLSELQAVELARLERLVVGVPERTSSHVDLRDVVRPLAESLRLRGTSVECYGEAAATGRPDDIAEIVHVLLANAARHAPGSAVRVSVFQTATSAGIEVSDNGPGVPPSMAERVFDRGVRGAESPGQGLGLHIARERAREMGGDLTLEPTSAGATFVVTLPLAIGAEPCLAHSA